MHDPKNPAEEEDLLSVSPVCWLLLLFSGFFPFLPLGFQDLSVGNCNLYLISHRSSRMELAYSDAPVHARLEEKAAKEE